MGRTIRYGSVRGTSERLESGFEITPTRIVMTFTSAQTEHQVTARKFHYRPTRSDVETTYGHQLYIVLCHYETIFLGRINSTCMEHLAYKMSTVPPGMRPDQVYTYTRFTAQLHHHQTRRFDCLRVS